MAPSSAVPADPLPHRVRPVVAADQRRAARELHRVRARSGRGGTRGPDGARRGARLVELDAAPPRRPERDSRRRRVRDRTQRGPARRGAAPRARRLDRRARGAGRRVRVGGRRRAGRGRRRRRVPNGRERSPGTAPSWGAPLGRAALRVRRRGDRRVARARAPFAVRADGLRRAGELPALLRLPRAHAEGARPLERGPGASSLGTRHDRRVPVRARSPRRPGAGQRRLRRARRPTGRVPDRRAGRLPRLGARGGRGEGAVVERARGRASDAPGSPRLRRPGRRPSPLHRQLLAGHRGEGAGGRRARQHGRRDAARGAGAAAARVDGGRRGGEPGEERVPVEHESRDPHADDGDPRLHRCPPARDGARRGRTPATPRDDLAKRQAPARADQRPARSLEGGVGGDVGRAHRRRPRRDRRRGDQDAPGQGRGAGHRARARDRRRVARDDGVGPPRAFARSSPTSSATRSSSPSGGRSRCAWDARTGRSGSTSSTPASAWTRRSRRASSRRSPRPTPRSRVASAGPGSGSRSAASSPARSAAR